MEFSGDSTALAPSKQLNVAFPWEKSSDLVAPLAGGQAHFLHSTDPDSESDSELDEPELQPTLWSPKAAAPQSMPATQPMPATQSTVQPVAPPQFHVPSMGFFGAPIQAAREETLATVPEQTAEQPEEIFEQASEETFVQAPEQASEDVFQHAPEHAAESARVSFSDSVAKPPAASNSNPFMQHIRTNEAVEDAPMRMAVETPANFLPEPVIAPAPAKPTVRAPTLSAARSQPAPKPVAVITRVTPSHDDSIGKAYDQSIVQQYSQDALVSPEQAQRHAAASQPKQDAYEHHDTPQTAHAPSHAAYPSAPADDHVLADELTPFEQQYRDVYEPYTQETHEQPSAMHQQPDTVPSVDASPASENDAASAAEVGAAEVPVRRKSTLPRAAAPAPPRMTPPVPRSAVPQETPTSPAPAPEKSMKQAASRFLKKVVPPRSKPSAPTSPKASVPPRSVTPSHEAPVQPSAAKGKTFRERLRAKNMFPARASHELTADKHDYAFQPELMVEPAGDTSMFSNHDDDFPFAFVPPNNSGLGLRHELNASPGSQGTSRLASRASAGSPGPAQEASVRMQEAMAPPPAPTRGDAVPAASTPVVRREAGEPTTSTPVAAPLKNAGVPVAATPPAPHRLFQPAVEPSSPMPASHPTPKDEIKSTKPKASRLHNLLKKIGTPNPDAHYPTTTPTFSQHAMHPDPLWDDASAPLEAPPQPHPTHRTEATPPVSRPSDAQLSQQDSVFSHLSHSTAPSSAAQSGMDLAKDNRAAPPPTRNGFKTSALPSKVPETASTDVSEKRLSLGFGDDAWMLGMDFDRAFATPAAPTKPATKQPTARVAPLRTVPPASARVHDAPTVALPDSLHHSPMLMEYA